MARSADAVVAKVERTITRVRPFLMARHEEEPSHPGNGVILRHLVHVAHMGDTVRSTLRTTASADLVICIIPAAAGLFLRVNFSLC